MCNYYKILVFICFYYCTGYSQNTEFGNNLTAGKYYNVNGIKIYCEIYGTGKPVLLLHGNGGTINSLKNIIPYFSKRFKVIAPDSRAHGKSIDTNDSISFEQMADDYEVLLQQLKMDSVSVIGWSDGGITAIELALRHPKRIANIVVTGANIFSDSTALSTETYEEFKKVYEENKHIDFSKSPKKNEWKVFLLDVFQPKLTFNQLKNITCPALIISGDKDDVRLEHTLKIYQNIPKGQLWILPKCGHATLNEYTTEFCTKVAAFLLE